MCDTISCVLFYFFGLIKFYRERERKKVMKEKFQKLARVILAVAAFVLVFAAKGTSVKAASDLLQIGETQNAVSLSWSVTSTGNYYLGVSDVDYTTARQNAEAHQFTIPKSYKTCTITGLNPGSRYYVYLAYTYISNKKTYTRTTSTTIRTTPGVVTGLNQKDWYRAILSVDITWDKQPAVDGYEFKFMDRDGRVIETKQTYGNTYSHKIKNSEVYTGTVRAYSTINGRTYYSEWCPTGYFMTQPAGAPKRGYDRRELDLKMTGNKLKVSWAKVNGIDKYNVYVATKRGGAFKKVKTVGKNKKSVTISKVGGKKIKARSKYYVYVEGVKIVNGRTYTTGINYITPINDKKCRDSVIYVSSWK